MVSIRMRFQHDMILVQGEMMVWENVSRSPSPELWAMPENSGTFWPPWMLLRKERSLPQGAILPALILPPSESRRTMNESKMLKLFTVTITCPSSSRHSDFSQLGNDWPTGCQVITWLPFLLDQPLKASIYYKGNGLQFCARQDACTTSGSCQVSKAAAVYILSCTMTFKAASRWTVWCCFLALQKYLKITFNI